MNIVDGIGPEAIADIRNRLGAIPVIFITGSPEACDDCDYASAILVKPTPAKDLTDAFRAVASTRSS